MNRIKIELGLAMAVLTPSLVYSVHICLSPLFSCLSLPSFVNVPLIKSCMEQWQAQRCPLVN